MNIVNLGETHLILLLVSFSVFIAWSTTWVIVQKRKVILFVPFLLVGFSTCFYAGLIFYSSVSSILVLKLIYFLVDLSLFILVLRRVTWKNH